jgi:hypothetical protein
VIANRAFVLLLLAACGGREERAPVSRPSPAPSAAPSAIVQEREEPRPPSAWDVKPSDVVVTGGFGAAKGRFLRPGDPKPGDPIEAVRFTCEVKEKAKTKCEAASAPSQSPMSGGFEERLRECFTVKSRAATAAEIAHVTSVLNSEGGEIDVPAGRVFVIERRWTRREEIMETHECPKDRRHACDPVRAGPGRFVDKAESDVVAIGPRRSDVSVPFRTWTLSLVELRNLAEPIDAVDVSTLPIEARVAVLFDRAVEAVRSKERKKVAAAVKEVDANVTIADGTRIEDQRINRTLAQTIVNEMPVIRAVAEGRATVGDACKK